MDSKVRTLILAVAVSAILWLLGGFVVGHVLGIIFTTLGIAIVGYAAGGLMDSPAPEHEAN